MKYEAKKHWAVELLIVSDESNLCCEQVIWCVRKLYKAVTANGNAGGVSPEIGDHFFHTIWLWADNNCDWGLLFQLVGDMCAEGCHVEVHDPDIKKADALGNLRYELSRVNMF